MVKYKLWIALGIIILLGAGCQSRSSQKQTLIIFHAGSVSQPVREVSAQFMKLHPGVEILHEAAGSVESARKITDLGKACDIFISADVSVIEKLLWPHYVSQWYGFASNALGLAYTQDSHYSKEIDASNWYEILMRKDVAFARSDPRADPCGYRTLFVWQLAEKYYHQPGLYKNLLKKDEHLIRPKETDLLALLETRNVDYIFVYQSLALQHGLLFLELPDSLNLSDTKFEALYQTAVVNLSPRVGTDTLRFQGSTILYGVALPENAPNPGLAQEYLRFLLDPDGGLPIFKKAGHTLPDSILIFPKNR
ncbi:MAG: extracellular solute-binding protein [Bacteroidales bacterium]